MADLRAGELEGCLPPAAGEVKAAAAEVEHQERGAFPLHPPPLALSRLEFDGGLEGRAPGQVGSSVAGGRGLPGAVLTNLKASWS